MKLSTEQVRVDSEFASSSRFEAGASSERLVGGGGGAVDVLNSIISNSRQEEEKKRAHQTKQQETTGNGFAKHKCVRDRQKMSSSYFQSE